MFRRVRHLFVLVPSMLIVSCGSGTSGPSGEGGTVSSTGGMIQYSGSGGAAGAPNSSGTGGASGIDSGSAPLPVPEPIDGAAVATDTNDGDSDVCLSPGWLTYTSPGCGADAKLVCLREAGDTPAIGIYYCGCNGRTIMGGIDYAPQPYQFKGCCPGDSGFGNMGAYSCPLDGGLPYYTPTNDGGTEFLPETQIGG
jgi:hypothetical protein